jgi:adenylate cyclase
MAADTILERSFVVRAGEVWTLIAIAALSLGAALIAGWLRALPAAGAALAGLAIYYGLCFHAFSGRTRELLPMAAPGLGLAGGFALALGSRLRSEERERRNLGTALARYLPPAVCERLLRDPGFLKLGGKRKELTLVVLEMHDFGEASERMEPEELEQLLGDPKLDEALARCAAAPPAAR